jgi:hypothetical protein
MQSVSIRLCACCTDTHSGLKPLLGCVAQLFGGLSPFGPLPPSADRLNVWCVSPTFLDTHPNVASEAPRASRDHSIRFHKEKIHES